MLTIFTIPRAFEGEFEVIQKNALLSWSKLKPKPEIILFGDEKGTREMAMKIGAKHIPEIKRNEFGTPILGWAFNKTKEIASNYLMGEISGDIILTQDFIEALKNIKMKKFLMVGQRWELKVREEIDFEDSNWQEKLKERVLKEGKLQSPSAIDYFIFPKDFLKEFPPFIVGSPGWDNWLIFKAKELKVPVIDTSKIVLAVHQTHGRPRKKEKFFEEEKKINLKLAGGFSRMCTLRDADFVMEKSGILKRPPFPRRIFSLLSRFYPWQILLGLKRKIQYFFVPW